MKRQVVLEGDETSYVVSCLNEGVKIRRHQKKVLMGDAKKHLDAEIKRATVILDKLKSAVSPVMLDSLDRALIVNCIEQSVENREHELAEVTLSAEKEAFVAAIARGKNLRVYFKDTEPSPHSSAG